MEELDSEFISAVCGPVALRRLSIMSPKTSLNLFPPSLPPSKAASPVDDAPVSPPPAIATLENTTMTPPPPTPKRSSQLRLIELSMRSFPGGEVASIDNVEAWLAREGRIFVRH